MHRICVGRRTRIGQWQSEFTLGSDIGNSHCDRVTYHTITWPILDRFPCTPVATTITITCLPEPATSSGHPGLLHLGDESVIQPLNMHFHPPLSAFPWSPTATSSAILILLKFSSRFRSLIGSLCYFCVHLSVSASLRTSLFAFLLRVYAPISSFWALATSSPPRVFGFYHTPTAIFNHNISCNHAVIDEKTNCGQKTTTATTAPTTTITKHGNRTTATK